MNVESNDWLDQQLAVKESYIPDDGFTANVVGHLPKRRRVTAAHMRTLVLAVSGVIALVLFVALFVPVVQHMPSTVTIHVSPTLLSYVTDLAKMPGVMPGIAAAVIALGWFFRPLLRRMS